MSFRGVIPWIQGVPLRINPITDCNYVSPTKAASTISSKVKISEPDFSLFNQCVTCTMVVMYTRSVQGSVLKDCPIMLIGCKNVVSACSWQVVFGDRLNCIWNVGPSTKHMWSFETGGLSCQLSLLRQVSLYFAIIDVIEWCIKLLLLFVLLRRLISCLWEGTLRWLCWRLSWWTMEHDSKLSKLHWGFSACTSIRTKFLQKSLILPFDHGNILVANACRWNFHFASINKYEAYMYI